LNEDFVIHKGGSEMKNVVQHEVEELMIEQRTYFHSGKTRNIDLRILRLKALYYGILKYEKEIIYALKQDLNKSEFEGFSTEIGVTLKEISFTLKNIKKWAKPKRVKNTLTHVGSTSTLVPEPYGITLILAPWNYPFYLAIAPLIGAIAAGNTAIVKPSELTPNVSAILTMLLEELYPKEFVAVIEGGIEASQLLLKQKFDYIFFTGSTAVGKVVMEAAAKQLIPVTLELGGKSPTIVHHDANLALAAKRIVWGKYMNAGQTCIAPDYVYVHHEVKEQFILHVRREIEALYGKTPLENKEYTRIVSKRHYERLLQFLNDGDVVAGGRAQEDTLTIEPTVLDNIDWNASIMQEEIFGPLLPVLEYHNIEAVIGEIIKRPKPLALYVFSANKEIQQEVVNRVPFGGGCINDTVYHIIQPNLPFGGVGESGIGKYHGEYSFQTFSHYKGIVKQTTKFDLPVRYSTTKYALSVLRKLLK
jgi:aldehyde dehydrogenase (NAD+)